MEPENQLDQFSQRLQRNVSLSFEVQILEQHALSNRQCLSDRLYGFQMNKVENLSNGFTMVVTFLQGRRRSVFFKFIVFV